MNTHEYLRQVHYGPREFVYMSFDRIGSFVLLRPIDMLYYVLTTREEKFCEDYLALMLNVSYD